MKGVNNKDIYKVFVSEIGNMKVFKDKDGEVLDLKKDE